MARLIYPGVYVLDTLQTEAFQSSRASKYLTSYTESRYENWQLALKQAELAYKMDYDAYTSRDKALHDLEESARKSLASAEETLLSLKKEDRAAKDKEAEIHAQAKTEAAKFAAEQKNRTDRTKIHAGANGNPPKSMGTAGAATAEQTLDALFKNVTSEADITEAAKKVGSLITSNDSDAISFRTAISKTGVGNDNISAYIAKKALELASEKRAEHGLSAPPAKGYEADLAVMAAQYKEDGKRSGGGGGGGTGKTAEYDPTLPEFQDRSEAIKAAEADIAAKKASYAEALRARTGLSAPKPNLVESARDVYANQFETLPGYLKHSKDLRSVDAQRKARENTAALVELFVEDRKKKLGENPSMEDLLAAKTEGAKDALFFLKHKELRGKAQNLNTPILEAGKVVGFKPAGFDIEAPMQDEKESLWDYIDGAKKGQPIPESLRGPLEELVSAPGSTPSPGARTDSSPISGAEKPSDRPAWATPSTATAPVRGVTQISGGGKIPETDPEEDYDLGETNPLSARIEQMEMFKNLLGNLNVVDEIAKPISKSKLDTPATVKIEKGPDAELVREEIKNKAPEVSGDDAYYVKQAAIKEEKRKEREEKQEERRAAAYARDREPPPTSAAERRRSIGNAPSIYEQVMEGHKLSKQGKKLERLTSTTSYGRYIKEIHVANKKSPTPQTAVQLVAEIQKNLPEEDWAAAGAALFALILQDK